MRDSTQLPVTLRPVDGENWREVAGLEVTPEQRTFVAEPSYYLALCHYDGTWNPLAIYAGEQVVGFMMWGIDDDQSCWLGGILVDQVQQRRGYGKDAVNESISMLGKKTGSTSFALSYLPTNTVAKQLYQKLGFIETGELEGDEVVARKGLKYRQNCISSDDTRQLEVL